MGTDHQKLRISWDFPVKSHWATRGLEVPGENGPVGMGNQESEDKIGAAGSSPVVGEGGWENQGSGSPSCPWGGSHDGGEGVSRALRHAQWPPPMTAHLGTHCALGLRPRTSTALLVT